MRKTDYYNLPVRRLSVHGVLANRNYVKSDFARWTRGKHSGGGGGLTQLLRKQKRSCRGGGGATARASAWRMTSTFEWLSWISLYLYPREAIHATGLTLRLIAWELNRRGPRDPLNLIRRGYYRLLYYDGCGHEDQVAHDSCSFTQIHVFLLGFLSGGNVNSSD